MFSRSNYVTESVLNAGDYFLCESVLNAGDYFSTFVTAIQ